MNRQPDLAADLGAVLWFVVAIGVTLYVAGTLAILT